MKINSNMNKAKIKFVINSELQKMYKQYKAFVNNEAIMPFDTKTFDGIKKFTSTEAFISFENNKYFFNVEEHAFLIKPKTIKAVAFHEFTHILDECTLLQDLSYDERKKLLHSYTEYHAIQLQMMCACNFENISDNKKLDNDIVVYDGTRPKEINEYINSLYKDYIATMYECIKNDCTVKNAVKMFTHSVYYQSRFDFFKKYHKSFSLTGLKNVCHIVCGDNFSKLIESILDPEANKDIDYFENHYNMSLEIGLYITNNQSNIRDFLLKELQNI